MGRTLRLAPLAALLLGAAGCGTIGHLAFAPEKRRWAPYSGVRLDIMCMGQVRFLPAYLLGPLALLDLPLSAVLDTVLLPVTGILTAVQRSLPSTADPVEGQEAGTGRDGWRSSAGEFERHLGRVEVGWEAARLLDQCGEPDRKVGPIWIYERLGGEQHVSFAFTIDGMYVTKVEVSRDCVYRTPPG